ncbi:MAG TPA: GNAT family N-acetyltransferase [Pseudoneobacillus sp.]|nr:GNAT family N-acetyltransferase [Pseudoneobacillus sp.]
MEVSLNRYEEKYDQSLKNFQLPKEQEQFTALPVEMLEINEERHPIVIVSQNKAVGFFVLHSSARVQEYTDNPKAMLLTAFSINQAEQGKGYAFQGMQQIKSFVQDEFPGFNEVVLAVNHKNIPAQKLYEKVGFKDTQRRKIGSIGEQFILSLSL